MKEKHCIDCHFLTEDVIILEQNSSESVTEEHRELLRKGQFGIVNSEGWNIKCNQGAWDQEYNSESFDPNEELNLIDRSGSCFFWKHNEKVSLNAAVKFEERQYRNKENTQAWKYTKIGLWIAVVAIVFSLIFNVLSFVFK